MVSENVGSGMLINRAMIFKDLQKIKIPNKAYPSSIFVKTISEHTEEIIRLYEREIEN